MKQADDLHLRRQAGETDAEHRAALRKGLPTWEELQARADALAAADIESMLPERRRKPGGEQHAVEHLRRDQGNAPPHGGEAQR